MNAETVESFLARGGTIMRLAVGEMADAHLTPRQRVNPDRTVTHDERVARKLAQQVAVPYSRVRKERRPGPRIGSKVPADSKRNARKNAILAALAGGPVSLAFIAGAVGVPKKQVTICLLRLKKQGQVVLHPGPNGVNGSGNRWGLPCP